jgi:hypothetical protein
MGALCLSVRFHVGNATVERWRRADMLLVALIHRHFPIVQVGHQLTPFILPTIEPLNMITGSSRMHAPVDLRQLHTGCPGRVGRRISLHGVHLRGIGASKRRRSAES